MTTSSCSSFQAVNIAIGTFAVVPTRVAAGENGYLDVEVPVFQMNERIQSLYELKPSKNKIPPEMLSDPLNFEEIAQIICFRTPIVEQCIHETLLFFAGALRGKKELDFFFEGLGILSVRRNEAIMNFFDDCALQLDSTGNMLPALLEDPKMLNMIAFRGKNKYTRCSLDGCIVLPRLELEHGQVTTSLKPQREVVPGAVSRRVSVYDPVMLARKRAAVVKKAEKKQKEEEEKKQSLRQRRLQRLLEEMAIKLPNPPEEPRPSASARRSREVERLAHVRALEEKRLQVLMAYKRKELEAEIQSQYLECTRNLSAERSQNPFYRRLLGCDPRPSYILRKEYDQKLKERLNKDSMLVDVYRYLLYKAVEPKDLPLLKELTTAEICEVWAGTSTYIRRQLLEKKAVNIAIGTFAVVPTRVAAGENGYLDVEEPVFQMNHRIQSFYKLKPSKNKIPPEMFTHPLNFEEIAQIICFRTPIVEQCIHETLLFFAEALRGNKELDFFFEGLGILSVRRNKAMMKFFDDCVLQLDSTGNMLPALLEDPEMLNMIAFGGKNTYTRCSQDGCIVLPRRAQPLLQHAAGRPREQLLSSCQIWGSSLWARHWLPGSPASSHKDNVLFSCLPCAVSVYDPVLLARQMAALEEKAEKKRMEEEEKKQSLKLRRLQRLLQEMAIKLPKPPEEPRLSASARRSREAERLAQARALEEKRLQVLMAYKRKELEAEIQSHKLECTRKLSAERSQKCGILEHDLHPSYIQGREYDQNLSERLNEKD
ncbi:UNVERIFIED_CONTAM: hypothetical protein H355_003945, partial [Colinus virginianus]